MRFEVQEYILLPDYILSTDWALGHLLAALGAGAHVPALQHHTVDLLHILRVRILTKYNAYR